MNIHPGLFAGILAGLVLAPAVIKGIGMVSGLVNLITGATTSASLLAALGYIALIGAAGYAGYKGATWAVDKLHTYTGMGTDPNAPTDMSGQTLLNRVGEKMNSWFTGNTVSWEDQFNPNSPAHASAIRDIKSGGYQPTPGGMISANQERDRRFFLLSWWDAVWG